MSFTYNLLLFLAVKEFWKSAKYSQSYDHQLVVHFFGTRCSNRKHTNTQNHTKDNINSKSKAVNYEQVCLYARVAQSDNQL